MRALGEGKEGSRLLYFIRIHQLQTLKQQDDLIFDILFSYKLIRKQTQQKQLMNLRSTDYSNVCRFSSSYKISIQLVGQLSKESNTYDFYTQSFQGLEFDLNQVLMEINKGLPNLQGSQIFLVDYDNQVKHFLGNFPFDENVKIGQQYLYKGALHLTYRCLDPNIMSNQLLADSSKNQHNVNAQNKKKVKQRTIQEAFLAVQKWRKLYDNSDIYGRKLYTLDQAAKAVGIAKKTLDDYFNHLKIAKQYNFDIHKYKYEKFGLLRKFVKVLKEDGQFKLRQIYYNYMAAIDVDQYWVNFNEL